MASVNLMNRCILLAGVLLIPSGPPPAAQTGPVGNSGTARGAAIGSSVFNATSAVLLQAMKDPKPTVGLGPRRLDFRDVSLGKPALNVVTLTNGTPLPIVIETLTLPAGFCLESSVALPLSIPAQTQALLTIEFLPTHSGNYGGALNVEYRKRRDGALQKMRIELRGIGVQE